ncbi:MAG: AAA family ATPase [Alphaproteobacteria bacterium]
MVSRSLQLPRHPTESFFLWGPRQTGKTSLLETTYPDAPLVDLLRTDEVVRYGSHPASLREELLDRPRGSLVVLDDVQKVPALLDEVHWLIEKRGLVFELLGDG